ncbi:MAG: DNA primase [Candidatus Aminicenantes bacterium]|nr:MAG: DNA primase [Candidatus Aminicenantes bacterium]
MEFIEQIRQAANIIDIASQYTTLRKRGRKFVGLCPFHSEKAPSFTVDDEKQLFHCFGCGAGGDIFTLVKEKENLSFPEALNYLAEKYNIPIPTRKKFSPQRQKQNEKLYKINEDTLAFFKKNLFNTQEGHKALDYLKKRNIPEEVIQKLKIGYALNSWDSLLSFFKGKNISADVLEKAGLVLRREKKEGYYDRFRGRIIFPIFDLSGKTVGFGGRTIFEEDPKYLNSPDTPVYSKGNLLYGLNFCKESIREKGEVILVEGYTDFVALYQEGITNIAAPLGTSLTSQQVSLARRFAQRIIVSFDSDAAGKAAALRAISICFENGAQIRVLILPKDLDPDSFLKKYGPEKYNELIKKSLPGLTFLMDSMLKKANINIPEEKAKVVKEVAKEIEKMPDSVVRSEYLKRASEYLSVDEATFRSMIQQKPSEEMQEEKGGFFLAEKRLLQILIENKEIAPNIFPEMKKEDFQGLKSEPIFSLLVECFKKGEEPNFHEPEQKIDPSLLRYLTKVRIEEEHTPTTEEALDYLYTLRQLSLENRAKKLKAEITRYERKGEKEKLPTLMKQLIETKKQLEILSKRNYQNQSYIKSANTMKERS